MYKSTILALLISGAFFACVGDIGTTLKSSQANRMLSNDSTKRWVRISRTDNGNDVNVEACENKAMIAFSNSPTKADTIRYFLTPPVDDCDQVEQLLYKAVYEISTDLADNFDNMILLSKFVPSENAPTNFTVIDFTTDYLKVTFRQGESDITEIYSGALDYQ